jgi:hypothetical protein
MVFIVYAGSFFKASLPLLFHVLFSTISQQCKALAKKHLHYLISKSFLASGQFDNIALLSKSLPGPPERHCYYFFTRTRAYEDCGNTYISGLHRVQNLDQSVENPWVWLHFENDTNHKILLNHPPVAELSYYY